VCGSRPFESAKRTPYRPPRLRPVGMVATVRSAKQLPMADDNVLKYRRKVKPPRSPYQPSIVAAIVIAVLVGGTLWLIVRS